MKKAIVFEGTFDGKNWIRLAAIVDKELAQQSLIRPQDTIKRREYTIIISNKVKAIDLI